MSTEETKIPQTGEDETALVLRIPETAKIPEGATFYEGEDDTRCRVIKPGGERCGAVRMRAYGICAAHAGRGILVDPKRFSEAGHAAKKRKTLARATLGISARRASQPLQAARVAAQLRANDYARAVVDAPLDDPELGSVARQQAAIRALELLYPQVHASLDLSLPEEPDQVGAMGWQEMQAMAAQLLGDGGDQQ